MWVFFYLLGFSVCNSFGYYCKNMECPGFSLIRSWVMRQVSPNMIEIEWETQKIYNSLISSYEVRWYAPNCSQCIGFIPLNKPQNIVKIPVETCTNYTIEIYGYDFSKQQVIPAVFNQMTAGEPLRNGTAVIVASTWAVLRWLQNRSCPDSTHVAICHGRNTVSQFKIHPSEGVVLFNVSGLKEDSKYICEAFTFNSAGSSRSSNALYFSTVNRNIVETNQYTIHAIILTGVLFLSFTIFVVCIILIKMNKLKVPWRGSYALRGGTEPVIENINV